VNTQKIINLKLQSILSILAIFIGLMLLLYMIVVEDEPGAIPLILIVFGVIWYLVTKSRSIPKAYK